MSISSAFSAFGGKTSIPVLDSIMHCRKCLTRVPKEAEKARFCVECGSPVAQPCPYEDAQAPWLQVRATNDSPLTECPHCRNILLACDTCGRLYALNAQVCRTPRCKGQLIEPGASFPSPLGPLDGSRSTPWPTDFKPFQGDPTLFNTAPLQALACRYGRLVGISDAALYVWSWQGGNWQQQEVRALPVPPISGSSLLLENGQVSVLLQGRAETYSLSGLSVDRTVPGAFSRQAMSRRWWIGQEKDSLQVIDVETGASRSLPLPPEMGTVTDLHLTSSVDSETVILAGDKSLVLLDPVSGESRTLVPPGTAQWIQTGLGNGHLFALGFAPNGDLTFCRVSLAGIEATHTFPGEMLGAFALSGAEALFVNDGQSRVEVVGLDQLTRASRSVSLPGTTDIGPDFQALQSRDGKTLLLLRLKTPSSSKFMLLDTASGATVAVPGAFGGTSLFCIADARLVIAAVDGGSAKLRTYQF